MVTFKTSAGQINEYYGLSTDKKPSPVPNASIFYEMDTRCFYMFDAANSVWINQIQSKDNE